MEISMIRSIVVEDEGPARERLLSLLDQFNEIKLLDTAEDGRQAVEIINRYKPDLIFLDISLPIMNGFEVLKHAEIIPEVIFITAYDEYAIKAFDFNAVDYLLKPVSSRRLGEAIGKIQKKIRTHGIENNLLTLLNEFSPKKEFLTRITIKDKYTYRVVEVKDIVSFAIEDGLIYSYTESSRYQINKTIKELKESLDPEWFFQIRRNCIINLQSISEVVPWGKSCLSVKMLNKKTYHVSRYAMKSFKEKIVFS